MKPMSLFRPAFILRLALLLVIFSTSVPVLATEAAPSPSTASSRFPEISTAVSVGVEFIHIAHSTNINANTTRLNHPLINGNPNAVVLVTPNYNPAGVGGVYENHPIGVLYDVAAAKWAVYNQDAAPMDTNTAFNVLIPTEGSNTFVQMATAGNTSGNQTLIDNALTNNNPNALVFVTPNNNPGGGAGTPNNHPIGVYFNTLANKWAVFNQDLALMPNGAAFNVFIPPTGAGAFVQRATVANIVGNWTTIDHPLTNNNPYVLVFATPNYNPGATGGTYDNHNIGVYYVGGDKQMAVFNQDGAAMPVNASFNVLLAPLNTAAFVHRATSSNTHGNYTDVDNPLSNGSANAIVLATPNWNPSGSTGVYNDHPIGVWYNTASGKWAIFNQDSAAMPNGASFNALVFNTDASEFVHTATAADISANSTALYYPLTNGRNNAIVFTTPNYNPGGGMGTYEPHPIAVWYNAGAQWAVLNQDLMAMPLNAAFNVFVPPAGPNVFVQTAIAANIVGDHTIIDSPLTNNNSNAIVLVTPNYNPGGAGGTYDNHNIGVYYDTGVNKWAIFNQDLAAMPTNAAFNVFVTGNRVLLPLLLR